MSTKQIPIRVELLSDTESVSRFAPTWNSLFERAGHVPFASHAWYSNCLASERRLAPAVWCAYAGSELVGVLPLFSRAEATYVREVRTNTPPFLPLFDIIAERHMALSAATAIIERIESSSYDALQLFCVAENSALGEALSTRGIARVASEDVLVLSLPTEWEAYESGLNRRLRKQHRAFQRKNDVRLRSATTAAEAVEIARTTGELNRTRWHERGSLGVFDFMGGEKFFLEAARDLFDAGLFAGHVLELSGRPVAGEYGVLAGGQYHALFSGMAPGVEKWSVGHMLTLAIVARLIEQRATAYHFGPGIEAYKLYLRAKPQRLHTYAHAFTTKGRLPVWSTSAFKYFEKRSSHVMRWLWGHQKDRRTTVTQTFARKVLGHLVSSMLSRAPEAPASDLGLVPHASDAHAPESRRARTPDAPESDAPPASR